MNHLGVQLLSLLAFGALALAMDRHQEDIFGRALAPGRVRTLRAAGWLALGLHTPKRGPQSNGQA